MATTAEILRLPTPLGAVVLTIDDDGDLRRAGRIEADVADPAFELPSHLRADRAALIELRIFAISAPIQAVVSFDFDAAVEGTPESGQWLEAIAFENESGVLDLATRDAEWMLTFGVDRGLLPRRFRRADAFVKSADWLVSPTWRGLRVELGMLRPGERALCPFAVSYLLPPIEDARLGPWFGVDAVLP